MRERWTDKKRGFLGESGNLMPNVPGLSLNRFMRENLGGLDQTQIKRFTPEGNVTVKGFGMYEKIISEPIILEPIIPSVAKERLVLQQAWGNTYGIVPEYDHNRVIQLIDVGESSHEVIVRLSKTEAKVTGTNLSLIWNPLTVSWNYDRNCFIAMGYAEEWLPEFGWNNYFIYEIYPTKNEDGSLPMTSGVATKVAKFGFGWSWYETSSYHDWMMLHTTYSDDGTLQIWLGFGEDAWWNVQGIFYFLPLGKKYGFTNSAGVVISPTDGDGNLVPMTVEIADCGNYHDTTGPISQPRLVWVAPGDVRITKDPTPGIWEDGTPIRRGCIAGNKVAYIRDTMPQAYYGEEFEFPMAIDETNGTITANAVLIDGHKETPPLFLENKRRVYTGWNESAESASAWWAQSYSFTYPGGYLVITSTYPSTLGGEPIEVVVFDNYWGDPLVPHEEWCFFYVYPDTTMQYEEVRWIPSWDGTYEQRENPFGGPPEGIYYASGDKTCAIICWYHNPTSLDYYRENIADVRYIKKSKKYVVMGNDEATQRVAIRVLNETGREVYQIPFEHPVYADDYYTVLNSLERVFTK